MNNKNKRFVKVMAWVLSILMAGSCATLLVTLLMQIIGG